MTILKRLQRGFTRSVLKRGSDYFDRSHVIEIDLLDTSSWSVIVEGTIDYEVILRSSGRRLLASCDCPFGELDLCKHIWAAILAIKAEGVLPGSATGVSLASIHDVNTSPTLVEPPAPWRRQLPVQTISRSSARQPKRFPKNFDG